SLKLSAQSSNPAVREIGFAASQTAVNDGGAYKLRATVPGLVGRSADNAVFNVSLNGTNAAVTVAGTDLRTNRNIMDLVVDVQRAVDAAGFEGKIEVGSQGKKLLFKTLLPGATAFSITATGNAVGELGLAASKAGTSVDLVITTRDGAVHNIVLDGATTIGAVVAAIESGTGGKVDVQFSHENTRLLLLDTTGGSGTFLIQNAFGSHAATDLGILRAIVLTPEGGAPSGDEVPPGDRIESGLLGGVDPMERLFLQNARAAASLAFSTPSAVEANAQFGFVGIEASGEADLTGTVSIGLKPPGAPDFDPNARITLKSLIDNIGNVGDFLD
ncbi:unnamed protein product, partial [Phaeothamnion confervicola]